MFVPYTANDLVRVMEHEIEERHRAAESSRKRLLPATEMRIPVSVATRSRFASMLSRIAGVASS